MQERLAKIVAAWENLRAEKSFAGMTLAEFKAAVQTSLEARERVEALRSQLVATREQRDEADRRNLELFKRVVAGIKADAGEGENGELYASVGYVRPDERRTGLTRKRGSTAANPPLKAA